MRDFFKPWRRKVGVVTLVLACFFAAAWVRSFSIHDLVWTRDYRLWSGAGYIVFEKQRSPFRFRWDTRTPVDGHPSFIIDPMPHEIHEVAHSMIVIPLTMLSAYLLLSKPRQTAPKQTTEPEPATGA